MKKFLFLPLFLTIAAQSAFADIGDNIAKALFQKKVDQTYAKALACSPQERDPKSTMDINGWIKIQPTLPSWQKLAEIENVAKEARDYARSKSGNDKVRHCLAGCYVSKKLDYTSAVLVGWYKELSDASDCSPTTSFEKQDYYATVKGARAGRADRDCEVFCKKMK